VGGDQGRRAFKGAPLSASLLRRQDFRCLELGPSVRQSVDSTFLSAAAEEFRAPRRLFAGVCAIGNHRRRYQIDRMFRQCVALGRRAHPVRSQVDLGEQFYTDTADLSGLAEKNSRPGDLVEPCRPWLRTG
jgi:hypothetical protein